ncbi:putative zn(2)-C6 fungal-type DNA-binding domain, fungal transcription factor [Septoria linicola]|nr:putative zn(2)-C6 fungal-type DNA-binding domain, fungal transcription factor [Septoria linicola]
MPLRSTGCLKCRQRKIRCDETRPGCKKCEVHGVACPGYKTKNKGDVEFHDQTDQTVQRIKADIAIHNELKRLGKPTRSDSSAATTPDKLTFQWTGLDFGTQPPPRPRYTVPVAPVIPVTFAPSSPIFYIHSTAATRMRLYDTFLSLFVPHDVSTHGRGLWSSHKRFLIRLMALPKPRPSLSHALDALTLVQIGSIHQDRQVLNKAVEAYTKSLRSLAVALSKPESVHDDTILATICILSSCEFYTHFRSEGQSWISHQQGMQRLLNTRGPTSMMSSSLAVHLFFQITTSSVAMSLMLRKSDPYAAEMWRSLEAKAAIHDDYSESNRLGLQLPALLERNDRLDLNHAGSLADLDDLLFNCEQMQVEMRDNLMGMHAKDAQEEKSWIALVEIEHFQPFASLVQDQTMTRAFRFPSFQTGYIHSSHWARMFMLRRTMRCLHDTRQRLVPGWSPAKKAVVLEKELLFYVLSLCRLIPFFLEKGHGAAGDMCCFFMIHTAEQYFRSEGHWRWLQWIKHVSERVFTKGMSMPFGIQPGGHPGADEVFVHDERNELAFNKIEFPNAPLLSDVGRKVTPQGTVWMPSRPASASATPSPTYSGSPANVLPGGRAQSGG